MQTSQITLTLSGLSVNANNTFKIGNVVVLNLNASLPSIKSAETIVLMKLPSGFFNATGNRDISGKLIYNGIERIGSIWIRNNGDVVLYTSGEINTGWVAIITGVFDV